VFIVGAGAVALTLTLTLTLNLAFALGSTVRIVVLEFYGSTGDICDAFPLRNVAQPAATTLHAVVTLMHDLRPSARPRHDGALAACIITCTQ